MYAGAWDDRFGAVVPVCSVGNYQAYLGTACCMCEVVPGAPRFTEEGGVLGLTAPRGLMVINVTKDGVQFSIPEAKKSLAFAAGVYKVYDKPDNVRHTTFDWHHDYSQAMREALYGWLDEASQGRRRRQPDPRPGDEDRRPRNPALLPRRHPARGLDDDSQVRRGGGTTRAGCREDAQDADAWRAESARLRETLVDKGPGRLPLARRLAAGTSPAATASRY